MEIGYHNRTAVLGSPYRYFDRLIDLATWADFLIAAAPGGAGTRHLVDADVLTALGPKGYLVNVGRGTIVDEPALIDALERGHLSAAVLDVTSEEPLPEGLEYRFIGTSLVLVDTRANLVVDLIDNVLPMSEETSTPAVRTPCEVHPDLPACWI